MSELQPPVEGQMNGGGGGGGGGALVGVPADAVVGPPKRQRRPSVRLGDIGDQHTFDNQRRTKQQQWKFPSKDSKSSKTRPLVNLTGGGGGAITGTKRVRSNWGSKMDEGDEKFDDEDDYDDDGYRDFDREGSGSQLKEQSLNFSMDNERDLHYVGGSRGRDGVRVRVSDGVELDGPSDTDARNWNNNHPERNGVRVWLNQLGLGRYAPVFEIHEVDDEVLPLLTLEDLKDMGINAVGSRRKMFCSIQKLGKGFS
ncbi:Sterile alpha motif domain-containing protein [Cynara cardunculus var. scolymus]|uniref:Sterile alpha motif domain-containing protein n=1 Tax=Cynara cardunculus var. scolymus TaxID=59895 RepID=A0A103XY63_CYNCS|nr:Sterile alpha motif domain-containing protein [Cynara cardunculus var. scolymus]